jgi:hypothetical protein
MFLVFALTATVAHANMDEAKEMFDEAKCMECHTPNHFKHNEKKVNSYKKLSDSVRACATNNGAEWFDEDSDVVTEYLNDKHYHYKVPPKEDE